MASHTCYDYKENRYVTISHDSEEYKHLMSSGEDGGEVVESGRTVSPHVNSVPVQGSKWSREAWERSVEKAKREAARENPARRKANRLAYYCMFILLAAIVIGAVGGLIISAFLGLIAYLGLVTVAIMYLISPFFDR